MDHVVCKVEHDAKEREIGEWDFLCKDDIAISILAKNGSAAITINEQLPDLEFFARDSAFVQLGDGDNVQKPVCAALVCNKFCAVRVKNRVIDAMPIPAFRARELS